MFTIRSKSLFFGLPLLLAVAAPRLVAAQQAKSPKGKSAKDKPAKDKPPEIGPKSEPATALDLILAPPPSGSPTRWPTRTAKSSAQAPGPKAPGPKAPGPKPASPTQSKSTPAAKPAAGRQKSASKNAAKPGQSAPAAKGNGPSKSTVAPKAAPSVNSTRPDAEPTPQTGPRALQWSSRYVHDDGRMPRIPPQQDRMSFKLRGEYQLRFRAHNRLPLQPRIGGDASTGSLGQNAYLYHWLRLKPTFRYRKLLEVVGEFDLARGPIAGQTTQLVSAARDDHSEMVWYNLRPRQLYLQYNSPVGMFRVGQQTSHWGMGLLANDGDHPTLFGDYRRGSIVERVLFATKPMGRHKPLELAVAGDLVFWDTRAELTDDIPGDRTPAAEMRGQDIPLHDNTPAVDKLRGRDRAFQAIGAVRWREKHYELGLYGVFRHQERQARSLGSQASFTEYLQVGVLDFSGKFRARVPGARAFVFGEAEAAAVFGSTNYIRNVVLASSGDDERIMSYGGAVKLGVTRLAESPGKAFGRAVLALEYGYASGDADPYDGVSRRFTFSQNHNVGLVLFDHVLGYKSARSATLAQDPLVSHRPAPGLEFLPSEGAIFGASYLNATAVFRPKRWLDLKAGLLLAQTTADLVDPFQAGAFGNYNNYEGGDPSRHNLGAEIDLGLDARIPINPHLLLQAGIEGGVFLPGAAFQNAAGARMPNQYLLNTRLGAQF